jgi:hypothetical protein
MILLLENLQEIKMNLDLPLESFKRLLDKEELLVRDLGREDW